jgi:hypothetical protein
MDALLRNAHGTSVKLRMPAPATAGLDAEQLGLATPEFQDIALTPVVFRKARAKIAAGKPAQWELLVSETAVKTLAANTSFASASAIFASAAGVLIGEVLMTIISATEIEAGGAICGYRLLLREPIALEV